MSRPGFAPSSSSPDEIVCRHCDHYVNQVSAHGETEAMAPVPQLYSEDRNLRFDALWRSALSVAWSRPMGIAVLSW